VKPFDYAAVQSVDEATALLGAHPGALLLAGGTDLIVQLRAGRKTADLVVDIKRIPELNEIRYDPAQGLTLGAAVPYYRICADRAVSNAYPALADVAALIGDTQIQGRASIGGNLCNAAPSADAIPILIALRAKCRIAGAGRAGDRGRRFLQRPGAKHAAAGRTARLAESASRRASFRRALSALHPEQ
jgi:CO/xanthine dehydrogenase FAD-binding subunit